MGSLCAPDVNYFDKRCQITLTMARCFQCYEINFRVISIWLKLSDKATKREGRSQSGIRKSTALSLSTVPIRRLMGYLISSLRQKSDRGHKIKAKCVGVLEHLRQKQLSLFTMTEELASGASISLRPFTCSGEKEADHEQAT